jgi:hypothetical protein
MRNILLLTSTIRPKPGQPQLLLSDPKERLRDYANALSFQVSLLERNTIDWIVFADNSGYDLSPLRSRYPSSRIEWISFHDLDYDASYHRGYGESRLIDHAFAASATLSSLAPVDRVWKVTGRYIVRNLRTIIAFTPRSFDIYCDLRGSWAEMSLMAWSPLGYELHVSGLWRHFATDKVPELILAERLETADRSRCRIVTSMYWPPRVEGRRGTDGTPFQGRFTPVRLLLAACVKLLQWPFRRLLDGAIG